MYKNDWQHVEKVGTIATNPSCQPHGTGSTLASPCFSLASLLSPKQIANVTPGSTVRKVPREVRNHAFEGPSYRQRRKKPLPLTSYPGLYYHLRRGRIALSTIVIMIIRFFFIFTNTPGVERRRELLFTRVS